MEMVLVLAVLVAVAALALPALRGPMDDQRLRKAGDIVRAQWAKARVRAMKTGRMQVFRYEIGSELYSIQSWADETDALEGSADPVVASSTPTLDVRNMENPLGVSGAKLPPGITFLSGESTMDSRSAQLDTSASSLGSGMGAQPIFFYPDGSATDSRLVLTNQRFCVELKLRGLTGLSRGSDLLTTEEVSQ
jgi:Tfp pilus assembly protein FimT